MTTSCVSSMCYVLYKHSPSNSYLVFSLFYIWGHLKKLILFARVAQIVRTEAKVSDSRNQFSKGHPFLPPPGSQRGWKTKLAIWERTEDTGKTAPPVGAAKDTKQCLSDLTEWFRAE